MDLNVYQYLLLAALGVAAGVINMMAGGGSNLILPVLMMFGVPADIANGSNRVGVLLQSVSGLQGFRHAGKLPTQDLPAILWPTLIGGLFGALVKYIQCRYLGKCGFAYEGNLFDVTL
ncbi:MAG TPA: TSUP family transporter, partial [Neisseria sp.]|nr:TSUP family transporter [Neisseria sp.]